MNRSSSRRLLVIGASGLVGSALTHAARAQGWHTEGAARSLSGAATLAVDATDADAVKRTVEQTQPDVIVIASAFAWVDGCEREPERSRRENVTAVKNVVEASGAARVVFFSTDHVFDGTHPFNVEADPTHPLSVYATHKRQAEELLLSAGRCLIVRTSYVFGVEQRKKNFVYRVLEASTLKVPRGQAGAPTHAGWLANSTLSALDQGLTGVLHLTGSQVLTKAQWARRIAKALGLTVEIIETSWEEAGQVAPRPDRVELRSTRHHFVHPDLDELLPTLPFRS